MSKAIVATLAAALAACTTVSPAPETDKRLGSAVNAAKAAQIIDPNASRNVDPVTGLDGESAKAAIDQYQKTFRELPGVVPAIVPTRPQPRGR